MNQDGIHVSWRPPWRVAAFLLYLLAFLLTTPQTIRAGSIDTLLQRESVWKYYAGDSYPDPNWRGPDFTDDAWAFGPGILGYGESYISTVITYGPSPNDKYMTTCFRSEFELASAPDPATRLTLQANYDDGFVAFLNGVEVVRRSMPPGPIDYSTAASLHEGGSYESIDISNHIALLAGGSNVLAVEVHQANPTSSDLVWDAALLVDDSQIEFIWSGAVTSTSARVKAKRIHDSAVVRLAVSDQFDLSAPIFSGPDTAQTSVNNRVVSLEIDGLTPDMQYYYAPEVDGTIEYESSGKYRTFPADSGSFTFAFASCATTGSSHQVFETIRSHDPLFFFHTGDFHYLNIAVNDRDVFRQGYETVLASPDQSALYRDVPIEYIWDDHDYGPNNSDSTAPGRLASRLTYQEYVPHYDLLAGSGDVPIYHAFTVGRVRFIVCDSRSARSPWTAPDNASKTMLGAQQKAWFKHELRHARVNYPLIVWVNSLPWIGVTGDDGWYMYTYERREIANFIADNNITNLCMISGDAHMVAIDDGTNSDYSDSGGAAFPVMHAAALDRSGSIKGGPYSHGAYPGSGRFGLMTVTDTGDSIKVDWTGLNYLDQVLVSYSFAFSADIDQLCGDVDRTGEVDIDDVIALLVHILLDRSLIAPEDVGDVDCSGSVDLDDVIYLISYIFTSGAAPCEGCNPE